MAALAGVIGLLIILLIGVCQCGFFLFCFFYRKCKQSLPEATQNQDTLVAELILHDERNSIPTFANSCYQKHSSFLIHELSDHPADYCYPEVYSKIRNDRGSGLYDDTDANHYEVIPKAAEASNEKSSDPGGSILTACTMINQGNN